METTAAPHAQEIPEIPAQAVQSGTAGSPESAEIAPRVRGRGRPPGRRILPIQEFQAVTAVAQGITLREAAKRHGMALVTLQNILKRPHNQDFIQRARNIFKAYTSEELPRLAPKMIEVWEDTLRQKDAKAVDAMSRAYLNMEKVSASVSGEARQVESTVQHQGSVNLDVELEGLLRGVLGVTPVRGALPSEV